MYYLMESLFLLMSGHGGYRNDIYSNEEYLCYDNTNSNKASESNYLNSTEIYIELSELTNPLKTIY